METTDYKLTDIQRILLGEAPLSFLLEAFCRTLVIYLVMVVVLRILGKRMSGQITILDLTLTLMLGAIVAPSAEQPDRGVLQGALILLVVLLCHWGTSYAGLIKQKVEILLHGRLVVLIRDGVLQTKALMKTRISREQLYSELRNAKIYQLGQVERMYLEAYGNFTIYKAEEEKPGLSVVPVQDNALRQKLQQPEEEVACRYCGLAAAGAGDSCANCGHADWDTAVISKK